MASITTVPAFADLGLGSSTATRQVSRYVTSEEVEDVLSKIETSGWGENQVCYVVGTGKVLRDNYTSLKKLSGVDVVYLRTGLRPSILFLWLANYWGIVRVKEPERLRLVLQKAGEQARANLYIFDQSLESAFLKSAKIYFKADETNQVWRDPGYLIYSVDEDRDDSPTNIADFIRYEGDGPWQSLHL